MVLQLFTPKFSALSVHFTFYCKICARIWVFTDSYSPVKGQKTKSTILFLYGRIRVSENLYFCIFYAMFPFVILLSCKAISFIFNCFTFSSWSLLIDSTKIFQILKWQLTIFYMTQRGARVSKFRSSHPEVFCKKGVH